MRDGSQNTPSTARSVLELAEGEVLLSALEALLKGVLESEVPLHALLGPSRGPFRGLASLSTEEHFERLFSSHGCRLDLVDEPGRAVDLATRMCLPGRNGLLLLPAGDVLRAAAPLVRARAALAGSEGYGLALVVEDNVESPQGAAPARLLDDLGIARIEPNDISELRDMVEGAIRLSRSGNGPAAILVSSTILHSRDTITMRPNRIVETVDVAAAMRGRRRFGRSTEAGDLLRLARRLELNSAKALPSPGERAPLGLVAVGPAYAAAEHLLRRFDLAGRVPVLQLGMPTPLDESVVERLVSRCDQVVVLEARPGLCGPAILGAAEAARRRGIDVASVWWRELPPRDGEPVTLMRGDALRSSRLARKISHLLDAVSSEATVTRGLEAAEPELEQLPVPRRGGGLGVEGAIRTVRNLLTATSQWLTERDDDPETQRVALVLNAGVDAAQYDRVVQAEVWGRTRFISDGPAAVRECAGDSTQRLLVVCDVGESGGIDVARLATASVPDEHGERVNVRTTSLDDLDAFLEVLRESVLSEGVTILIARDGSPPRFDREAIERSFREVDRLGFTPLQRIVRPAEQACSLRAPLFADLLGTGLDRHSEELETSFHVDRLPRRMARNLLFRIRPLTEQVEVVRTRPPVIDRKGDRPIPPTIQHAHSAVWRCHVAGWRGRDRGLVPRILCEAGRAMGYRVGCVESAEQSGPGRGAWAQLLFTRPRRGASPALPIAIPYGEADLLLGVDPVEALRALGPDPELRVASPDRTSAVVNSGLLADQVEHSGVRLRGTDELLEDAIAQRCQEGAWVADLVGPARRSFLTERLIDMVALGIAYQRGLIPVSREAIEGAIEQAQRGEFGRLLAAFRHGRTLESVMDSPRDEQLKSQALEHVIRRLVRSLRAEGLFTRRTAPRFEELLRTSIEAMPGMLETSMGRPVILDFAVAVRHALAWGGMAMANQYASLIRGLYDADSGARSRRLTCYAVFPLAEAMLIRDPLFVATMASGMEQRRRIRERLAVRHARGDEIARRYLTRVELIIARHRIRLDVRASDWPARIVASFVRLVPRSWRGVASERELSRSVVSFVEQATREAHLNREGWERAMLRLNIQAEMGRMRTMAPSELRALLDPTLTSS